jgi:hypothetical protein
MAKTINVLLCVLLLFCILPVIEALDNPSNILCSAISMDYPGGNRQYLESDGLNWSFVIDRPYNYRGTDFLPCGGDIALRLVQMKYHTNVKWNFTPVGDVPGQNVLFQLNLNNGGPNSYACIAYGDNWVDEYGNKGYKPIVFINGYTEKEMRAFVSTIRITTYDYKYSNAKLLRGGYL